MKYSSQAAASRTVVAGEKLNTPFNSVPYHEVGVWRSYAEVVVHLYRTTKAYQRSLTTESATT